MRNPPANGNGGVTFTTGQAVTWPPAPGQLAQVEDLLRANVRLFYRCRTGRVRRPVVAAAALAALQQAPHATPPLPIPNPMRRGVLPRAKTFPKERGPLRRHKRKAQRERERGAAEQ